MEIHAQQAGTATVLTLAGRLTVSDQMGLLKEAVVRALTDGSTHIVLDLHGVGYIDSTRLGELIAAHIAIAKHGGRLTLVRVPARVGALLTLAGLSPLFEQRSSVQDAMNENRPIG